MKAASARTATALAVGLALGVVGCSGGSWTPPEERPLARCEHPRRVKIQLFGDSTLVGTFSGQRVVDHPERVLQAAADAAFGPGQVAIETRAVNGTTSADLLAGRDKRNAAWPSPVDADIVVVNFGINDRGFDMDRHTYRANLRQLAHAPARVVFQTPLPTISVRNLYRYLNYRDDSYASEMREVAREMQIPVADAGAFAMSIADWKGRYGDSVHPNAEGYRMIVTKVLAPTLMPIVAETRCASSPYANLLLR